MNYQAKKSERQESKCETYTSRKCTKSSRKRKNLQKAKKNETVFETPPTLYHKLFMLALSPRQQQILAMARQAGNVGVDELADRFEVTPQTIRKDLNELCDSKLLARTHGGAMLSSGVENMAYEARRRIAAPEKSSIGQRAAALVPNNCSLFINIGTTTEEVARALVHHEGLLVITNNIHVAQILMPCPRIDVIIVGGILRRSDGGIVGEAAVDAISQFKVDYAVMGVSAIDEDGALLDFDVREVRAAKAIMENSRNVLLVADAMKFERSAPVRIGHLTQVDTFVTDRHPPEPIVDLCRHNGVALEVAGTAANENEAKT
jgi:DeoR family transcriptional regulator, glycerol-3-phosphate regulon repressor